MLPTPTSAPSQNPQDLQSQSSAPNSQPQIQNSAPNSNLSNNTVPVSSNSVIGWVPESEDNRRERVRLRDAQNTLSNQLARQEREAQAARSSKNRQSEPFDIPQNRENRSNLNPDRDRDPHMDYALRESRLEWQNRDQTRNVDYQRRDYREDRN